MKNKNPSKKAGKPATGSKTLSRKAGELIGTIGARIAIGTAKVVDFVSDEAMVVKKAIKKKLAKKTVRKKPVNKKLRKKVTAVKVQKRKTANKPVRKKVSAKPAK